MKQHCPFQVQGVFLLSGILVNLLSNSFAETLADKPSRFALTTADQGCLLGRRTDFDDAERAKYPGLPHFSIIDTESPASISDSSLNAFKERTIAYYKNANFTSFAYYPLKAGESVDLATMRRNINAILTGSFDSEIRQFAQTIRDLRIPVQMAYLKEFSGYTRTIEVGGPIDLTANNPWPELYAASWRHVWNIFEQEGANTYVEWAWIGEIHLPLDFIDRHYPGDQYVDVVGWDWGSYEGHEYIGDPQFLAGYSHYIEHYPNKPIVLGEEKVGWERQADLLLYYKESLKQFGRLKYVNFFFVDWISQNKFIFGKISDRVTPIWDPTRSQYVISDPVTDVYAPKGLNEYQALSEFTNDGYFLQYIRLPLSKPSDQSEVVPDNGTITLEWLGLRDSIYEVKWSTDPAFSATNTQVLNTTTSSVVLKDYPIGSIIYWQVKATHSQTGVTLAESQTYSFNIATYEFEEVVDQANDAIDNAVDFSVNWGGKPVGQTFTTGNGITLISGVDLFCRNAYSSSSATSPTLSLYESPAKRVLLAQGSIPGFSKDFVYKWRRWDLKAQGLTPNTQYYMELTLPGDNGTQLYIKASTTDAYKRGMIYYTDYKGGMAAYSRDLCFRSYSLKESKLDQHLDQPYSDSEWIPVGWAGQPIGQTFTTGPEVSNICSLSMLCASYYGRTATTPTVSLYDSPRKGTLLTTASIDSITDREFQWRRWNLHSDALQPNTSYYFEVTTPGDSIYTMNVMRTVQPQYYSAGQLFYSNYRGGMKSYSEDLYFKTRYTLNTPIISYLAPLKGSADIGRGLETQYHNQPIGQTFTPAGATWGINGVALLCQNYYSTSVTAPTLTLYDSINKRIQLARATIPGFVNEAAFQWRFWPIKCDLLEPNKTYYLEVTTPGDIGPRMVVMTGDDGSPKNNIVCADTQGVMHEYPGIDMRYAIYPQETSTELYGLQKIQTPAFNGRVAKFTAIHLQWDSIPGARSYRIQYTTAPTFDGSNVNTVQLGLNGYGVVPTEYSIEQPTTLGLHSTWNWRVIAEDVAGNISSISPAYTFTVDNIFNEVAGASLAPSLGVFGPLYLSASMTRDTAAPLLIATQQFTSDSDMNRLSAIDLAVSGLFTAWRVGPTTVEIKDPVTNQIVGSAQNESLLLPGRVPDGTSTQWVRWQFATPLIVSPSKVYEIDLWMTPARFYSENSAIVVQEHDLANVYYRTYKILPIP